MKRCFYRAAAGVLCASFLLSGGCSKKKEKKAKEIKASDPYFLAETVELPVPAREGEEVVYRQIDQTIILKDRAAFFYHVQYTAPKEKQELMDRYRDDFYSLTEEELSEAQKIEDECMAEGVMVYGLDGHLICEIPASRERMIYGMLESLDGRLLLIVHETTLDPNSIWSATTLYEVSDDGQLINGVELKTDSLHTYDMLILPNGNLLGVGGNEVTVIDKEGKSLGDEPADCDVGGAFLFNGKCYIWGSEYDENFVITGYILREVDQDTGKIKPERIRYPDTLSLYFTGRNGDKPVYAGSEGIFEFDPLASEKRDPILTWKDTDVNRTGISADNVRIISNDEIYLLRKYDGGESSNSYMDNRISVIHLTRQEKNPHAGQPIIEVVCNRDIPNSFLDHVVEYNLDPNSKAHIVVRDYSDEYMASNSWSQLVSEVTDAVYLDLLNGDGPDIIVNFGEYAQFEREDVLVDLNQFIDGASPLHRDEYYDNIFRAHETDGKLFQIPLTYWVEGFVANSDVVGERTSWDLNEFDQAASSLPKDVTMIEETDWITLLEQMISPQRDLIDYSSKTVHYSDDPGFAKVLELVKKYGSGRDIDDIYKTKGDDPESASNPVNQFNSGSLAVIPASIVDLGSYWEYARMNGKKVSFAGYPSPQKKGMSASGGFTAGIARTSEHKEEAWDFIRSLLGEKTQEALSRDNTSIPVNRTSLDATIRKRVETDRLYRLIFGESSYSENGEPLTEEMGEEYKKMLANVRGRVLSDPTAMLIVSEEAPGYFTGQKSLPDVVSIIQNRCSTIVNERG